VNGPLKSLLCPANSTIGGHTELKLAPMLTSLSNVGAVQQIKETAKIALISSKRQRFPSLPANYHF